MFRSRRLLPAVAAVLLGIGLLASAYAASFSGAVEVTIEGTSGARAEALPGATVTITTPLDSSLRWSGTTDAKGRIVFGQVTVGSEYDITVSMPGYSTAQRRHVRVVASITTRIALRLAADLSEQVVVRGKGQLVDLNTETQGSTTLSGDMFQDLPVLGRDYQAVLALAPGVQDVDGDGNPNVHGSRDVDFRLTVDGVSNVDPLTGKFQSNINPDSIEELVVIDSGADASYGGAVGGFGQVITKSGNNRFEGTFKLYWQDGSLNKSVDPNQKAAFTLKQPSVFFSGPVLRDRLWFALSHEYIASTSPEAGWGGLYQRDFEAWRHFDKLTWQIDPKNRLQLMFRSDPRTTSPLGVDPLSRVETGYELREGGPTVSLKWVAPVSPTFSFESTLGHSSVRHDETPIAPDATNTCVNSDPENMYAFLSGYNCTNRVMGGRREGPYNRYSRETRARWSYDLNADKYVSSERWGEHRIKVGMELSQARFDRDLTVAPQETYKRVLLTGGLSIDEPRFAPPYQLNTVGYYFPDRGHDNFLDPENPYLLHPQRGTDESRGNNYSFYVTDTWQPVSNMTFTFGLRFSREELTSQGYNRLDPAGERATYDARVRTCTDGCAPACDPNASNVSRCNQCLRTCAAINMGRTFTIYPLDNPMLVSGGGDSLNCEWALNKPICGRLEAYLQSTGLIPAIRRSETFSIVNNALAPRVAASWDPRNDGKTRVFTSWGRYYGDTPLNPLVLENGPDAISTEFPLGANQQPVDYSGAPVPAALYESSASIHTVDRNLRMQHSDEWVLGFEREIAAETAISVRYVRREYLDQLQDRDINHQPITEEQMLNRPSNVGPRRRRCPMVDGYYDCTGLKFYPPIGSSSDAIEVSLPDGIPDLQVINPFFNNIYEIGNYNRTMYRALILELKRRWFQNWELLASYTRSRAEGQAEEYDSKQGNDVTNMDHEQGLLDYDQTHVVKGTARAHVPWLGGLRFSGTLSWQSGLPYSMYEDRDVLDFATDLDAGAARAYQLAANRAGKPWSLDGTSTLYQSQRRMFPTGRRNDMRNPAYWNLDLGVQKEFMLGRVRGTFEVDVMNVLNDNTQPTEAIQRTILGSRPDNILELIYAYKPIFGVPRSRKFQFGLKFDF